MNTRIYDDIELEIHQTYDANEKSIKNIIKNDNEIILDLSESNKDLEFMYLYFTKIEYYSSIESKAEIEVSDLDKVSINKPLKRIQISKQHEINCFCLCKKLIIWFDFEDESTVFIKIERKNRKEKFKHFECNYKIVKEKPKSNSWFSNILKTVF